MLPNFLLSPIKVASRIAAAGPWPDGPLGRGAAQATSLAMQPAALLLTASLRRLAGRRPDVFERLGAARSARILICPAGLPMAFLVCPDGDHGTVRVEFAAVPIPYEARIEAPFDLLLQLMQGTEDGDAAFFASELWIEGDTAVVLSLRNAIEEAEMKLTDLLPLPLAPWLIEMVGKRS